MLERRLTPSYLSRVGLKGRDQRGTEQELPQNLRLQSKSHSLSIGIIDQPPVCPPVCLLAGEPHKGRNLVTASCSHKTHNRCTQ